MNPFDLAQRRLDAKAFWNWLSGPKAEIMSFEYDHEGYRNCKAVVSFRGLEARVFGSCAVWHNAKNGKRMPTWVERMLSYRWALERDQVERAEMVERTDRAAGIGDHEPPE